MENEQHHNIIKIDGLYQNWFLDYASYVILDRAVPHLHDGLKPVQRRILHSLKELDDGRYNKVANVIGNTMKYHPHGDASIGDAMVQIGQKNLLIDCQGNWGNIFTGDSAAAPRYIEARLSKFGLEVIFNKDTTVWQQSYDGRNEEPVTFPVKFPLLLAHGVEGIAVGLATKILPHNFVELIQSSIAILKGESFELFPDFITAGMADISRYNDGIRGGKVLVRARIKEYDKKTLTITEIPFGTTTSSLIDSIIKANDKGKIKIKKIEDNTAKDVEILLHLAPGISPDVTIDALYAFTDCQISISPNSCVIENDKPQFLGMTEILRRSTFQTKDLLRQELEIELKDLQEKAFFSSLLKIFIQEGMYKNAKFEQAGSFDNVVEVLNGLFEPFYTLFYRAIEAEDYKRLIDKPMSSITRYDVKKADELMKSLEEGMKEVRNHLKHLNDYAIAYYQKLLDKYGAGRERKTELRLFDTVQASQVALANQKLYVNRTEGFVGIGLKKDEFVADCSDIDDIIVFREDGKFSVVKVAEKTFVGKNILHAAVFKKNDTRTVYHLLYRDGATGKVFAKRFNVTGITRDKEYDLTLGTKGSSVLYFTVNPNGEGETITVQLKPMAKLRNLNIDYNFAELAIKSRSSQGNTITKYPVKKVVQKSRSGSTLSGRKIWFDTTLKRLNAEERGTYLGSFEGEDKIVVFYNNGTYEFTNFDLTNHYDDDIHTIMKFNAELAYAAIHIDGASGNYFIKRFKAELLALGKTGTLLTENAKSKLVLLSHNANASIALEVLKGKTQIPESTELLLADIIDLKGIKAIGNRLSPHDVQKVTLIEPEITNEDNEEEPLDNEADENTSTREIAFEITNIDDIDLIEGEQKSLF